MAKTVRTMKAYFDLTTEQDKMFEHKISKRDLNSYREEIPELFSTDIDDSVSPYIST